MRLSQQRVVSAVLPARHSCRGLHAGGPRRCRPPCGHAGRRRGPPRPRRGDCCAFQRRRSPYRGRALWRSGAPRRGGLMSMSTSPSDLLRPDLQGQTPYGAPQMDVAVALNTNENSYTVPADVVDAIVSSVAEVASGLNRYPDREFVRLREDLAAYLTGTTGVAVTAEQVWAGNGSNEVLLHLLQAFGGPDRVALGFTPAYSMHPIITRTTGTRWFDGLRGVQGAGAFDLDVLSAVAQVRRYEPDIVFLCSPNNPTGTALGLDVVEAIYDAAPRAAGGDPDYEQGVRAGRGSLGLPGGRRRTHPGAATGPPAVSSLGPDTGDRLRGPRAGSTRSEY